MHVMGPAQVGTLRTRVLPCWHSRLAFFALLPTQERKELIGKKLNEQHSNWGSLLLGLGVTISIAGGFNTFLRTGGWAAKPVPCC